MLAPIDTFKRFKPPMPNPTDFSHYFDRMERAMGFWVQSPEGAQGLTDLRAKITIHKNQQRPEIGAASHAPNKELVAG